MELTNQRRVSSVRGRVGSAISLICSAVSANSARSALVTLAFVPLMAGVAWANGQEFFDPGADAKVDMAYVGRVRDTSGRFLKGVTVVFWSDAGGLTFPAVTDIYGHYRTPDIGASLKEVAVPVDPNELKVSAALPGYELVRAPKVPKKTSGRVVMDFVMRPTGSAEVAASAAEGQSRGLGWLIPGLLVLFVIGAAVRR
jgi:hypothetical protein